MCQEQRQVNDRWFQQAPIKMRTRFEWWGEGFWKSSSPQQVPNWALVFPHCLLLLRGSVLMTGFLICSVTHSRKCKVSPEVKYPINSQVLQFIFLIWRKHICPLHSQMTWQDSSLCCLCWIVAIISQLVCLSVAFPKQQSSITWCLGSSSQTNLWAAFDGTPAPFSPSEYVEMHKRNHFPAPQDQFRATCRCTDGCAVSHLNSSVYTISPSKCPFPSLPRLSSTFYTSSNSFSGTVCCSNNHLILPVSLSLISLTVSFYTFVNLFTQFNFLTVNSLLHVSLKLLFF